MDFPQIQIINLPRRTDRLKAVIYQMELEKAPYRIWEGIETNPPKTGISQSHKKIVAWAKENNMPFVIIAEDDLCWCGTGAYKYFLDQIPAKYDLYLGQYYGGTPDENNVLKKFSGTGFYAIHSRYYDKFLSITESMNLDNALSMAGGLFISCDKFVSFQSPGFSDNMGRFMNYESRLKGKPMFNQNETE